MKPIDFENGPFKPQDFTGMGMAAGRCVQLANSRFHEILKECPEVIGNLEHGEWNKYSESCNWDDTHEAFLVWVREIK